jgi:uncharacterized protein (DUF2252 family)
VAVQIRDLDQTVIGNPAHDLIRLALSLASAARGWELPGVTIARMLEAMIAGYQAALAGNFDGTDERQRRPKIIKRLLRESSRRRWRHLASERLNAVTPVIPLGKTFWALDDSERAGLEGVLAQEDLRGLAADLRGGGPDEQVALIDAAFWVKGCSSLGRLRYAVMLKVGEGEDADYCLIDIKEAVKAAAPRSPDAVMPTDNAARVVAGAKALSPNLGQRMIAGRMLGRPVVLRELMPQDLKLEVERLTHPQAIELAEYLASVLGKAHGGQMDPRARKAWGHDLARARTARLDAPSWLWSSVVDLIGIHERAYLEHCRAFALDLAKAAA